MTQTPKLIKENNCNCNNNSLSCNSLAEKDDGKGSQQKVKVIVVGDSLLNGINKMGLCKKHGIEVKKVPGSTTAIDKIETLVGQKPDCIIVYSVKNDITKSVNKLNTVKKI